MMQRNHFERVSDRLTCEDRKIRAERLPLFDDSLPEPDRQLLGGELASGGGHGHTVELVGRAREGRIVDGKEYDRRVGAHPLVSVHEGMIRDEGVQERRRLCGDISIEILAVERHRRPGDRRLQGAAIPQPGFSPVATELDRVDFENLLDREIRDQLLRQSLEGGVVLLERLGNLPAKTAGDLALFEVPDARLDRNDPRDRMDAHLDGIALLELEFLDDVRRERDRERAPDLDQLPFHVRIKY